MFCKGTPLFNRTFVNFVMYIDEFLASASYIMSESAQIMVLICLLQSCNHGASCGEDVTNRHVKDKESKHCNKHSGPCG